MAEYIEREAVVRYLKGYSEKECNLNSPYGMIISSVLNKVERALSEMPAADVQPIELKSVKIKEVWYIEPYYKVSNQFCVCPNCGKTFGNIKDIEKLKLSETYKFCNKCGQGLDWADFIKVNE